MKPAISIRCNPKYASHLFGVDLAGRELEGSRKVAPREMIVHDRTPLIVRPIQYARQVEVVDTRLW